jgi:hypothetical protein
MLQGWARILNKAHPPLKLSKPALRGRMTVVQPSAADNERLRTLLATTVLPRWVERCGPRCAEAWDGTLAPVVGVRLRPASR